MDKRKLPRVTCNATAEIQFDGIKFSTKLENLSITGMYARSRADIDFKKGSIIDIIIHGGSKIINEPIHAKGIINRSGHEGFAARFIKMSPADYEELKWAISGDSGI